jgi:hypothetical protein
MIETEASETVGAFKLEKGETPVAMSISPPEDGSGLIAGKIAVIFAGETQAKAHMVKAFTLHDVCDGINDWLTEERRRRRDVASGRAEGEKSQRS